MRPLAMQTEATRLMKGPRLAAALFLAWSLAFGAGAADPPAAPLDNGVCLGCHGNEGFSMPDAAGKPRDLHVKGDKFAKSVHGKRQCQECHQDITEIPHQAGVQHSTHTYMTPLGGVNIEPPGGVGVPLIVDYKPG